jgi:ketosteroid isomerase-like protein
MTIHDTVVAPDDRRVVIRSSMTSKGKFGDFSNEYCWLFWFDAEGEKITKIHEMFDSAAVKEIFAKRAALGEQH